MRTGRVSTSGDGSDAGTPDEDAGRDAESSEDEGRREGSSSEQDELGSGDDVDSEEDDDSDAAAMEEVCDCGDMPGRPDGLWRLRLRAAQTGVPTQGLYGKLKACEMVRNAWLNDQVCQGDEHCGGGGACEGLLWDTLSPLWRVT